MRVTTIALVSAQTGKNLKGTAGLSAGRDGMAAKRLARRAWSRGGTFNYRAGVEENN